jgi:hypothetical protein
MKLLTRFCATVLLSLLFLVLTPKCNAQSISLAYGLEPDPGQTQWRVQVAFVPDPTLSRIQRIFLISVEDEKIIRLTRSTSSTDGDGIYIYDTSEPLELSSNASVGKHYELRASVQNEKKDKILSLGATVQLFNPNKPAVTEVRRKAKDVDDADVYLALDVNGAHKSKASFSTEIKLQKYMSLNRCDRRNHNCPQWRYTPFFKLNASSDPGADPDTAEGGLNFRYINAHAKAYFDNAIKLESERDFGNTNLIYDSRLTFLPSSRPRGLRDVKVFFNPFIGGEFGKNLNSPLKAAEGDGIARILGGIDVRLAFYLKNEDTPDLNWTNSYIRRWPLTDELGFKTDDDGNLILRTFGTNPRDHVASKLSYKVNRFFDTFIAYEWGEVPPSYKLVDHRFRFGFAYKFKFGYE